MWIARSGPAGPEEGQSLMSTFGDTHRSVDMGGNFGDHEMRKQADLPAGALVVTGQESPKSTYAFAGGHL